MWKDKRKRAEIEVYCIIKSNCSFDMINLGPQIIVYNYRILYRIMSPICLCKWSLDQMYIRLVMPAKNLENWYVFALSYHWEINLPSCIYIGPEENKSSNVPC